MEKGDGYTHGLVSAFKVYDKCLELGIKEVSIYGFTQENTRRPVEQREAYRAACVDAVRRLEGLDADLLVVGDDRSSLFPDDLQRFTERTRLGRGGIKINLLINYSWRWDLKQLSETGRIGSWDVSEINLVVRWGGRSRLSGFLPAQCAYADLCVLPEMWPDGSGSDLERALDWYQGQDVTKGG
jgi:undecaprenyl diphosphate synthase